MYRSTVGQPRKLTDAQVEMVLEWQRTFKTKAQLARELNVSTSTIDNAIRRQGRYKQPSPELRTYERHRRKQRMDTLAERGWS